MQDKDHELIGLRTRPAHTRGHDFAEIESLRALRDGFQIVRIVILAFDENGHLFKTALERGVSAGFVPQRTE